MRILSREFNKWSALHFQMSMRDLYKMHRLYRFERQTVYNPWGILDEYGTLRQNIYIYQYMK